MHAARKNHPVECIVETSSSFAETTTVKESLAGESSSTQKNHFGQVCAVRERTPADFSDTRWYSHASQRLAMMKCRVSYDLQSFIETHFGQVDAAPECPVSQRFDARGYSQASQRLALIECVFFDNPQPRPLIKLHFGQVGAGSECTFSHFCDAQRYGH